MKSSVSNQDIINRNHLLYLIDSLPTSEPLRDKALLSFLYLTAARVSEVVRKIKKFQIEQIDFNGEPYIVINNVECLKRRKGRQAKRNIPINVKRESDFLKYIYDYINELKEEDVLFPISRQWTHVLTKRIEKFPHYLRHLRCTHLSSIYGFNSAELRQITGWTDDKPASVYVHLNWRDIASKMMGGKNGVI